MDAPLPLPTLLSQALVAFTIEFDNEFEHQMSHRTTRGPAAGSRNGPGHTDPWRTDPWRTDPWNVSMVMWSNVMQFVGDNGVRLRELEGRARMTNLNGLQRWGYILVEPDPADSRKAPPRADWLVRPTRAGRRAQEVWRPLARVIEQRWRARFGEENVGRLRRSLQGIVSQLDVALPPYLPVVRHDMFARVLPMEVLVPAGAGDRPAPDPDLSTLLSQVLLAFTVDFERESKVSLPMSANTLRVLDENGVRVRDLPRMAGISKEAISMTVGFLERGEYVVVERDPAESRTKRARLTAEGLKARDRYRRLLGVIEDRWRTRFDHDLSTVRECLERLIGDPTSQRSPLLGGLEPYPDGWRASVRKADTLPHYPMILHRGGYPDGS